MMNAKLFQHSYHDHLKTYTVHPLRVFFLLEFDGPGTVHPNCALLPVVYVKLLIVSLFVAFGFTVNCVGLYLSVGISIQSLL